LNFFAVSRGDDISNRVTEQFNQLASQQGMVENEEDPQLIVSIGGDGTMLQAFHRYIHKLDSASFLGIHTGHLGFFADWMPEELDTLVSMISAHVKGKQPYFVHYPLVKIDLVTTDDTTETHLALNEFTLKGVDGTLVAELCINDQPFEMFRGDGICISSPIGSTAYNKSLGGALLHPSIEAIQIAEIASINNRVFRTLGSSMILPKHHHCDIHPKKSNLVLSLDHISVHRNDIKSIRLMVASEKVQFIRYRPFPFWNRVREAFIGREFD
jgi:NAD+ kinase